MALRRSLWLNTVARPPIPYVQAAIAAFAAIQDQQTYGATQATKAAYVAKRSQARVTGPNF